MKNMNYYFDSIDRAQRVREYRINTLKVVAVILAITLGLWQLFEMGALADERNDDQPWLMDLPEEVVEIEEAPPVDNFWGYEYTPIVITWYGKHVRKFKHELEPFRAFGAQASSAEVQQQCEDKIDDVEKALKKSVKLYKAKEFAFVVTCLGKYIVKTVEEEDDEETEDEVQAES